ncbi:MAG TPA: FAD-binding oxidoreductase, partial [Xanthobacteraceae bacterium]|nr:FAD-binding oxidoreductase [Xanthobacteraceae bacterium]
MNTQVTRPVVTLAPELIGRFATIAGEKYALTDPVEQEPYLIEGRGLYRGRTPLVLRPGSVDEVAAIVRLANETATPIVPQGGNTGLVGGQIPHDGEVVLSLKRLDRIREVDVLSDTITCEAGVVLAKAQEAAAQADRLFPLSLGAEGSCTIGGNLSTNAGGTGALAYGVARDLVVGLEVVLADGRILNALSKLKKDNTGYDLKNLFIGAEGTLGVITAASLKLFPAPKTVETAFIGVPSPQAAVKLLSLVQERTNRAATSFELICRLAMDFALRHGQGVRDPLDQVHPWYVLLQVASAAQQDLRTTLEEALETAMERGLVNDAAVADSVEHRRAFWHLREILPEAQKPEGGSIKH